MPSALRPASTLSMSSRCPGQRRVTPKRRAASARMSAHVTGSRCPRDFRVLADALLTMFGHLPAPDLRADQLDHLTEAETKIAPHRFNPTQEVWLPVLHTQRGARHYTALYPNTARAHELARTHDWVVLYFDGHGGERQCTVITAMHAPMHGRPIVRRREAEFLQHYSQASDAEADPHRTR